MLPSLGALSLGTPTGAKDDVVKEIRDEREADKKAWEAWHNEQEMQERMEEQALREKFRAQWWSKKRAAEAQEATARKRYSEEMRTKKMAVEMERSLAQKAEAASEEGYASVREYEEALEAAAKAAAKAEEEAHAARMRAHASRVEAEQAAKAAEVARKEAAAAHAAVEAAWAAAPAADSSGDENDDEPLDGRADRRAPKSPPIHMLEPGPFSLIVNELAKRLRPGRQAINNSDADALCRDVGKACRELATLNQLPGQAVDPKYDCSDPNSPVWRGALVIFGVNPAKKHMFEKSGQSRKDWFRDLCQVFNPQQGYYYFTEGHSEPRWYGASLWATLKMMHEEGEVGDIPEYELPVDPKTAAFARKVRRPLGTGTEVITWRLRHLPGIRKELDSIESDLAYSYKETKKHLAECRARTHDSDDDSDDDDEVTNTHCPVTTLEDYEYPAHEEDYQNDVRRFRALKLLLKALQFQAQDEADRLQMAPVSPRSLHGI